MSGQYVKLVEEQNKKGTYAGIRLSEESLDDVLNLCEELGLPNITPRKDIHITLLYSRKYIPNLELRDSIDEEVDPMAFHVFDTFDKKRALVLKLDSPYCINRHKELMEKYDATYDYPEYIPHVTLSYDIGDMKMPEFDKLPRLRLVSEYEEDLKLEWKPKK